MKIQNIVTVISHASYYCMPNDSECPDMIGLTLRQALRVMRTVNWGSIGRMYNMSLSDGSWVDVVLRNSYDGGKLMSSQRAVRRDIYRGKEYIVRTYKL